MWRGLDKTSGVGDSETSASEQNESVGDKRVTTSVRCTLSGGNSAPVSAASEHRSLSPSSDSKPAVIDHVPA